MQTTKEEKKEERIVLRCEPSFFERATRVAEARYAGNRSYMVRRAVVELLDREEATLPIDDREAA